MKITTRCGERAVEALNEALLAKARPTKLVRLDKVRADTTVVEANVAYPSDSGLLAKGVAKLARLTKARDRTRSMRRRAHSIGVAAPAQRRRPRRGPPAHRRDGRHRFHRSCHARRVEAVTKFYGRRGILRSGKR